MVMIVRQLECQQEEISTYRAILTYRPDLPQICGVMFLIVTLHLFIRVVLVLGERRGRSLLLYQVKPPRGGHVLNQQVGLMVVKVLPAVPPELLERQGVVTIIMLKQAYIVLATAQLQA